MVTPNKSFVQPANNTDIGVWDVPMNANVGAIDTVLGGLTTLNANGVSGVIPLTLAQYTPVNIVVTGAPTANVLYELPIGVGGFFFVSNQTTGGFDISFGSASVGGEATVFTNAAVVIDPVNGGRIADTVIAPGGSFGQLQWDNNGVFAGTAGIAYDPVAFGLAIHGPLSANSLSISGNFNGPLTVEAGSAATFSQAIAFAASAMPIDCSLSNVFGTQLTGYVTSAPVLTNMDDGQTINWRLQQDATGNRTMVWPANFRWPGGAEGVLSTAPTPSTSWWRRSSRAPATWLANLLKGLRDELRRPPAWMPARRGGGPFVPVTHQYPTVGTFTETIPTPAPGFAGPRRSTSSSAALAAAAPTAPAFRPRPAVAARARSGSGTFPLTSADWGKTFNVTITARRRRRRSGGQFNGQPGAGPSIITNGSFSTPEHAGRRRHGAGPGTHPLAARAASPRAAPSNLNGHVGTTSAGGAAVAGRVISSGAGGAAQHGGRRHRQPRPRRRGGLRLHLESPLDFGCRTATLATVHLAEGPEGHVGYQHRRTPRARARGGRAGCRRYAARRRGRRARGRGGRGRGRGRRRRVGLTRPSFPLISRAGSIPGAATRAVRRPFFMPGRRSSAGAACGLGRRAPWRRRCRWR